MGGIQPSEAKRLTYWEFTAMRYHWNAAHHVDNPNEPVEPPSEETVREAQAELRELGISGRVH